MKTLLEESQVEIKALLQPIEVKDMLRSGQPNLGQTEMTLEDYAKAINEAHQSVDVADRLSKKSGRDAIAAAMKAGQYLIQVKELVSHGNWLPWVEKNCPDISDKTAQRYMKLAKNDTVSDLSECSSLRQAYICTGAITPGRYDKAPEVEVGKNETVKENEANTPEIILSQMQNGFSALQRQYDSLVKQNPELQTHLLSVAPASELTLLQLLQRWQYPLSDAFNYFKLPSIEAACVRCGHVRESDEYFVPIHHWSPEYKNRFEWCESCVDDYHDQLDSDFDITQEIQLLIENLNELKSLSVKDYTLAQKLHQLKVTKKFAESEIITAAENNVWMPTDLDNEELTINEIEGLAPRIVIVNAGDKTANTLWNIYRHCMSSAVNNQTPGRYIKFLVVDDSRPEKPVLGIGAISGDFPALDKRDEFIGWTKEQRETGKLNHTAVGSTIVATQPFASNFNGGKLIAALITSKAIRDEWQSRYGNDVMVGMTTTSLFGVPSMYDQIKQWKRLGLTTGRVPIQPGMSLYNRWKDFVQKSRSYEFEKMMQQDSDVSGPVTNYKTKLLTMIFKASGIKLSDYLHGFPRGIYFSEFYENTKYFLCGRVTESELVMKPLFQESVEQITDRWHKQAINRYKKLKAEGKLKPDRLSYSQLGTMDFETARKTFLDDEGQ
jgi:hypothetical protein